MSQKDFLSGKEPSALILMLGVGILGSAAGFAINSTRFWSSFLLNAFYFLTLALGSLVFLSIHHIANAGWSAVLRRIPEAMTAYLPFGAATMLLTFFGRKSIYEWSHGLNQTSTAMQVKSAFLTTPFFYARMFIILAVWLIFARWLRLESERHEADGQFIHIQKSKRIAGAFLAFFALTFSLASFDWLMSLLPEFYSTIFAFYCFSGLFVSGIATVTLFTILLRRRGFLPQVNEDHLHNLGKLLFGFSTFWAYLWLSQYLLIYYANLPEETVFYLRQTATPFGKVLFIANLFLNWVIPFLMLISRQAKRQEGWLLAAIGIVLVGHWLDLYLLVIPVTGNAAMFSWIEVALAIGFASLFVQIIVARLRKMSIVPLGDPYLGESLTLHSPELVETAKGWSKQASRQLTLATIAFMLSFAVWGLVGALAPRFREMYGLSPFQTALLIAVPVLLGSIGRLPMGILADKFGGRLVMGLVLCFCLVPAMGASFTSSYSTLVSWGLLIGVAGTSFSVGVAFASKWFPADQQGTALGIYGMGNIGQSITVFGAPAIVAAAGDWRLPFWVFGAAAGLFGVIFLWLARNAKVKVEPKRMSEYFALLKREPLAWVLSLFYFQTFGGFVALGIYLPTLLKDLFGLTPTDAGARVAGFVVVATGMRPIGGWLADRYGGAPVLMLAFAGIALLALGLASSSMFVFTIGALGTAAMLGLGNGAVFKLVPEYFPRETGTITGLVGAAGGLGGFFPPLVLGIIKGQTGSYTLGFVFLACFAGFCLKTNYFIFARQSREREAV